MGKPLAFVKLMAVGLAIYCSIDDNALSLYMASVRQKALHWVVMLLSAALSIIICGFLSFLNVLAQIAQRSEL